MFSATDEGRETPTLGPLERANLNRWTEWLMLALPKEPNKVDVTLPSPKD
jgi:hypothetical protein